MDIAELADYVIKWFIPTHPEHAIHKPYLERAQKRAQIFFGDLSGRPHSVDEFLEGIDGVLYVEHPVYRQGYFGGYDIIEELERRGVPVFGLPMWEWWPEDEPWALRTNALWAVTKFTSNYLKALEKILFSRGIRPKWSNSVYGDKWGVNVDDFEFIQRSVIENVVFVRGNAGYKDRKASNIILPALQAVAKKGVNVTVYTQADMPHVFSGQDLFTIKQATFPSRKDIYKNGDLYIFCSYWEGLCHGIYEACFSGGLVATTDFPPMNECLPAFKVPISAVKTEKLGKEIAKALVNPGHLEQLILKLHMHDCSSLSTFGNQWISKYRSLRDTLREMHDCLSIAL